MVASFVDASTLLCTSPSAEVAGAAVSTSLDFSSAPANLTLYSHPPGVARVSDGVLWLTDVEFEQTGTAILPLPGASIMGEFFASFDLYAGGGSGGEGVSFNVGELPASYFDERGWARAFRWTSPSPAPVEVWYAGTLVAESTAARAGLSSAGFATVEVWRSDDGLTVSESGVALFENVTIVDWSPSASWRGLRRAYGRVAARLPPGGQRARARGERVPQAVGGAEVSLNGQSLTTDDAVAFSYFAAPAVSALRFERGPTCGGTSVVVTGSSFRGGSNYVCRFGAKQAGSVDAAADPANVDGGANPALSYAVNEVQATYHGAFDELHCVSPPPSAEVREVEVRVERAAVHDERRDVRALRADPCVASAAARRAGRRRDGADGVRRGFSRGRDYRCKFEGSGTEPAVVVAAMEDDGRSTCTTPAARCGSGACLEAVEVSINSEAYSSDGVEFTYHNATVSAVSVVSGPAFGGTALTVRGARFVNLTGVDSLCSVAHTQVVASFVDASTLRCDWCRPPPTPASAARATLTLASSLPASCRTARRTATRSSPTRGTCS